MRVRRTWHAWEEPASRWPGAAVGGGGDDAGIVLSPHGPARGILGETRRFGSPHVCLGPCISRALEKALAVPKEGKAAGEPEPARRLPPSRRPLSREPGRGRRQASLLPSEGIALFIGNTKTSASQCGRDKNGRTPASVRGAGPYS